MQRCEIFSIFLLRIVVVMVRLGDSHITVYADMHTSTSTNTSINYEPKLFLQGRCHGNTDYINTLIFP